ncbi:sugar ABC transporter ATP-binding protein [Peribacillus cavernae]|uniref:Sugar ABC transporter ATP-binding protein n=1 Tax=Peribacillus cavernae TaxID=1674310 RepID=A0A433HFL3_9BACI|nr:sugar ABC transporter ATP-binding protein [Peribacillus cavernae]MDQ0219428.1 ABC-type sugar transport system ATPase subunit [Peribacillus cavernae]RUQ27146.1 sugar ABC transporter ATP-binding protein [Peribacillus cavernae]
MTENVLEMKGVTKIFPGMKAVDNVDFTLKKGEVHALLGGNGAGKTTLMKILAGVYQAEEGTILIDGQPVQVNSRRKSQELGIAMIFQELSIIPNLTVAENLFLSREKKKGITLDQKRMHEEAKHILDSIGLHISPMKIVKSLSIGERQMIEIARAISTDAKIIVMDEPTTALTKDEQEKLFELIKRLKTRGTGIIYVSHRMDEIFEISDRLTVLRDGKRIETAETKDMNMARVIDFMLGDEKFANDEVAKEKSKNRSKKTVLEVKDISFKKFKNISFEVFEGEILGITGLLGSGRTEILRAIAGLDPFTSGIVKLNGKECNIKSIQDAISQGIIMVPEDRKNEGIIPGMSIQKNLTLTNLPNYFPNGLTKENREREIANKNILELNIQPKNPNKHVGKLSGGNQQKVVISRCLNLKPKVLLLDEPTQGIDIVAKTELQLLFRSLARQGMAIIVVSSELPELVALADRTIILYNGQITKVLDDDEITDKNILYYSTGGSLS